MKKRTPKPEPRKPEEALDDAAIIRLVKFQENVVFEKSADQLDPADVADLRMNQMFYAYRHNDFVLIYALELCVLRKANPPIWVLESIMEKFLTIGTAEWPLSSVFTLSKRDREEFCQYTAELGVMIDVRDRIEQDPKRKILPACRYVANRRRQNPETLEKIYRRFWKGFFDYCRY